MVDRKEITKEEAKALITELANESRRSIIGIIGKPGGGKSTLSKFLIKGMDPALVCVVPMDGFHLSNKVLKELGRSERKGAPDTFDVNGSLPPTDIALNADYLKEEINKSPRLKQIKASSEIAENRLRLEEKLVNPGVTLKAGVDQDPDITSYRFGLSIPIPIWNQRQGQIGEAAAGYRELQAQYTD